MAPALTVACVEWGNYLGRGVEYVAKLEAMVARNLHVPYRFDCVQPDVGLDGWWNKIELFRPGRFEGRVLYLDLDTVIVGDLAPLTESKGLLHLERWGWTRNDYGSGVMVWDAGEHSEIWTRFDATVPKLFRGDQDYLTALGGWEALPDGLNVSYRYHCKNGPPQGARTVSFHGVPKPHEVTAPWVAEHWRL